MAVIAVGGDLNSMDKKQLRELVLRIRGDIRWHRDQRGDDRCWLDDIKLYENLPGYINPYSQRVPPKVEFLRLCGVFQSNRQVPGEHVTHTESAQPRNADEDLDAMDKETLILEVNKLRNGIHTHLEKGEKRGYADDAALYALLPERTKAITRLPPELLQNCARFCALKLDEHPPRIHEW